MGFNIQWKSCKVSGFLIYFILTWFWTGYGCTDVETAIASLGSRNNDCKCVQKQTKQIIIFLKALHSICKINELH